LVFGFTYFVVAVIYAVVRLSAVGERARTFKSVSPGMLRRARITGFNWPC